MEDDRNRPVKLALAYAFIATVWIVLSDLLVAWIFPEASAHAQLAKGLSFVLVTASVLYLTLRRWHRRIARTELSLGRSSDLLTALYDQLDDAVFVVDENRRIIHCSPATRKVLGYEPEELLGQTAEVLYPSAEDHANARAMIDDELAQSTAFRTHYKLRHKQGHTVDAEVTIQLTQREPRQTVGIVRDVTEQKRTSELLAEQQAYLDSLLTHVTDVVAVVDDDDNVVFVSPSVERVLGLDKASVEGRSALDLVHPEDREQVARALRLARKKPGTVHSVRHRALSGDGSWLDVQSEGLRPAGGGIEGTIVSVRDLSAQLAAEQELQKKDQQLKQAQKMEAIGRLAGGVAHDFNNLLTVIFTYVNFLNEEIAEDSLLREDLDMVVHAAKRASDLTGQLLLMSRQRIVQPAKLAMQDVVKNTASMMSRLVGEDISLQLDLSDDLPPIFIDEGELVQVLMNLVVNARDAMPRGGQISIQAHSEEIGPQEAEQKGVETGPYVCVVVQDTGEGMSEETASLVFEPFFTTKSADKGTGLGLSTSYGIVANAGGWIDVKSEAGKGTVFSIFLPQAPRDAREGSKFSEAPPSEAHGERILLVEDDRLVRKATHRLLEDLGYQVLVAANADEARAIAHDTPVDLLFTDVVMPGLNGRELAQELRAAGVCTRTLYMSGYTPDELLRRDIAEERDLLLTKPFSSNSLKAMLRQALEEEPPASTA